MLNPLEPFLTPEVQNAIIQHMDEDAPNEACGMITFTSGVYNYVRKTNVHRHPTQSFAFSKAVSRDINVSADVVAFVHSHPNGGDPEPSMHDMETQILVGKPSVICCRDDVGRVEIFSFGDHLLDLPLDGRVFRYGVTDCYEAIRAWRWQKEGVRMDPYARANGWWNADTVATLKKKDQDFYSQYYADQGFVRFTPNLSSPSDPLHPQVGDLILMQMGGIGVINHAAIYIGNNLIYHHRQGKKSGPTPLGYCLNGNMIRMWGRQGDRL